ncbi:MAG: hypothetical protein AAB503_00405 [Patescibacteria group bacterium]
MGTLKKFSGTGQNGEIKVEGFAVNDLHFRTLTRALFAREKMKRKISFFDDDFTVKKIEIEPWENPESPEVHFMERELQKPVPIHKTLPTKEYWWKNKENF